MLLLCCYNVVIMLLLLCCYNVVYSQMAKEIEDRLRAKYTLIDKTDPVAIAAAQQAGIPISDDGELVGEVDMKGFNVGSASSVKPVSLSISHFSPTFLRTAVRVMTGLERFFNQT